MKLPSSVAYAAFSTFPLCLFFDGCECWVMVCDNYYLFGITLYYSFFDKYEISLILIVDVL